MGTRWPLIGRERELGRIERALVEPGAAGLVLSAPAGAGKSRLARAALDAAVGGGALGEWVQATGSAATVPLAAVAALLPDGDGAADPPALMRRCAASLRERAGRRRAIVAVDDAQLLDPASAALVLHLVGSGAAAVLATVRDDAEPPDAIAALWKDAGAERLALEPLGEEATRALIEAALEGPVEQRALDWAAETSGGNPLYVRELVEGALAAGTLVRDGGLWRLTGAPSAGPSLIGLVERRLDGLDDGQREVVELLALGEPLRLPELIALTSEAALIEAEARGLLQLRGEQVLLAHPLYGEAVRAALRPLRARLLSGRLAAALTARSPLGDEDALRVARLSLDAGAPLAPELALRAARAANRAGDPELGVELAALAEGMEAALVGAQAHALRDRYAEAEALLAEAEPLAAADPAAGDYLKERLRVLHWGLRRPDEVAALLDRAAAWPGPGRWSTMVERLRRAYLGLDDDVPALAADAADLVADARIGDETRRTAVALHTLSQFLGGDGAAAAAAAWEARPPIPLRDAGDTSALGILGLVGVESGVDWPALEEWMGTALRAGVRAGDEDAAGIAAFALARLRFHDGRYRDAARWLAEAEVHLDRRDAFGTTVNVRALEVGIAVATRDLDGADAALERMRQAVAARAPTPMQRVSVARAEGWATRLRSEPDAARRLLADAAAHDEMPGLAVSLAYEALRAGAQPAEPLAALAARAPSPLAQAYAAHGAARADGDGAALLAAAERLAAIGARRYGLEAALEASAAFLREGRHDSARRAAHRAQELHPADQGTPPPRVDGLDATAIALTPRETQLAELAGLGLSNAEIADRLVLSVRTVETHLYRAMQKLGVRDRRELRRTA